MAVDQTNVKFVTEGMIVEVGGEECTVLPKCDDTSARGAWRCATHGKGFANNLAMWGHTDDGKEHVMAWVCFAHGVEVP
jgi:hypothetical protein